jgi:zinc transporter 1
MRGVFLHVMGDALGNIGVIGTALFIWLTDYSWRFYADPLVSLIITVIILLSAIPLCKAASRILLQAVPEHLSIDDIKEDITDLDGIISCHHLHVWQLSDTKLIASLHVQVDFDFKGDGSARYMDLARQIRLCLHEYGIHSSTIQPEFCLDKSHDHSAAPSDESSDETANRSKNPSLKGGPDACLLECPDSCGNAKQCCEPTAKGCNGNNGGSSAS